MPKPPLSTVRDPCETTEESVLEGRSPRHGHSRTDVAVIGIGEGVAARVVEWPDADLRVEDLALKRRFLLGGKVALGREDLPCIEIRNEGDPVELFRRAASASCK